MKEGTRPQEKKISARRKVKTSLENKNTLDK